MISSHSSVLISTTALALAIGYLLGRSTTSHDHEEYDDSEITDFDSTEECKMVLVVRTDIGMGKGKAAAQCAHAALACYESASKSCPNMLARWKTHGQAKITLQCTSEDELYTLQAIARSLGVTARAITDAGRTQIAAGTTTVLGVGPAPKSIVDQITGHLKLY